ncbi:MAG: GHKL domain-containing protein [Endomicrobium sp.]|jgi:signal transduction histidine kinase|nr:GHKL domain-containing protein [Endomicrobium sp.]
METNKLVKWSEEAREFFESSIDNSVDLTFIVCHDCKSQTEKGFEEFVNSINNESIKRKIRKLIILDASYLYRHSIPGFAQYSTPNILTIWRINNQNLIDKLTCNVEINSWAEQIKSHNFKRYHKQILLDYTGDENGNGLVQEFRDIVTMEAQNGSAKGKGTFEGCRDFILEECAHACAYLKDAVVAYPMPLSMPMLNTIKRYDIQLLHLYYMISNNARNSQRITNDYTQINQKLLLLLTEKLNINFYVTDKFGNFIYKNNLLSNMVHGLPADIVDPEAWKTSKQVIETRKQIILEERYKNICFFSVKSPLIINDKVEGMIGFAVDITDRKKTEELQQKLKLQKELLTISSQVAHDIASPLSVLKMLTSSCFDNSNSKEQSLLNSAITSIENIINNLLEKYKQNEIAELNISKVAKQYTSISFCLNDIIASKRFQYKDLNVVFNYSPNPSYNFVFIKGDYTHFYRMISNLINNAVESLEGKEGIIDISFNVKQGKVEVKIKDNGKGMPKETVEKIMKGIDIGTTKQEGSGIGLKQIRRTLKAMNGQMFIEAKENVGTEITLIFSESEIPQFVVDKIALPKGNAIVVLDDDISFHEILKNRFENYLDDISVKYFTQGLETIDFINSAKEKDKIFLLSDYQLRDQNIDGIEVIEKCNMQDRHILITSMHTTKIKDFDKKCKFLKILNKSFINDVSILIEKEL